MPNLKSIAEKNGVSIEEAIELLGTLNFRDLSADAEISDITRILVFDRALYNYKRAKVPRKRGDETRQSTKASPKLSPEEQQQHILSCDYLIFTLVALQKPQCAELFGKISDLIRSKETSSVVVITSASRDALLAGSSRYKHISEILQYLSALEESRLLKVLPCKTPSDELSEISDLIALSLPKTSIALIGTSRPLHAFVENHNKRLKQNPPKDGYTPVIECDVSVKGTLTAPASIRPVFDTPDRTELAQFDADTPLLPSGKIPSEGSTVYIRVYDERVGDYVKRAVVLESLLFENGEESMIYSVRGGKMCVKILRSKALTEMKIKKIELMCRKYTALKGTSAPLLDRIAWPEKLVYNENDLPLGYLMKYFRYTHPLSDYTAYDFEALVPSPSKEHQIRMAKTLCELFEFCHGNNILLGAISKSDILYDSDGNAYLCDLDSVQLCDRGIRYPKGRVVPEFLPPERSTNEDLSFIQQKSDDVWALQLLLFFVLTPFGSPYAFAVHSQINDMIYEPTIRGLYPYGSATVQSQEFIKKRHSLWDYVVSHLHYKIRDDFYGCFSSLGTSFSAETRKTAYDWLEDILEYRRELPNMIEKDRMSGEYLPTAYRRYDDLALHNGTYDRGGDDDKITASEFALPYEGVSTDEAARMPTAKIPTAKIPTAKASTPRTTAPRHADLED